MIQIQTKFQNRRFSVIAFPTNDYHQELSSNEEIRNFLNENHPDLNFPIMGLSQLDENPVYQQLRQQLPNDHVKHNFFKYLVDRNGKAIKMFHKKQDPITFVDEIERLLDQEEEAEEGDSSQVKPKLVTS